MAKGFNGGIIGSRNLTTGGIGGSAVGIYSVNEAQIFKLAGLWPQEVPSGSYQAIQVYTNSSTWTVPSGVSSVDYLIIGGGGGGLGTSLAISFFGGSFISTFFFKAISAASSLTSVLSSGSFGISTCWLVSHSSTSTPAGVLVFQLIPIIKNASKPRCAASE
jgi:hypothetical protein